MERMITPTTEEEWPRRDDHLGQDLKRVAKRSCEECECTIEGRLPVGKALASVLDMRCDFLQACKIVH